MTTDTSTGASTEADRTTPPLDMDALMSFVFRAVDEVGATLNCRPRRDGRPARLLPRTGRPRPAATPPTWRVRTEHRGALRRASGSTRRRPADSSPTTLRPSAYTLPAEHAVALTDESSPAFLPGFFQIAFGTVRDADRIFELARDGDGLGWGEHNSDVHTGCERFFRPGYAAHLVAEWLPALDGVVAKLEQGARVA